MSLLFYLFTFAINLSHCGTGNSSQQMSQQCLSTINMVFSDKNKILINTKYTQNAVTHVEELKLVHLKI